MKNFQKGSVFLAVLVLTIIVVLVGTWYYFKNSKQAITIVNPNGAEEVVVGERFRFTVRTDVNRTGVVKLYFTKTNNIKNWTEQEYYFLGSEEGRDFNNDGAFQGTGVLEKDADGKTIKPGTYYMLALWSDGSAKTKYDFTDGSFIVYNQNN